MRVSRFALMTVLAGTFAALAETAPRVMNPGQWEITVQTISGSSVAPVTSTVCISDGRARKLEPPKTKPKDDCQLLAGSGLSGNVLSYTLQCSKKQTTTTSRYTYSGDTFEGLVTIQTPRGEIRQQYSGKRVGDCETQELPLEPVAAAAGGE